MSGSIREPPRRVHLQRHFHELLRSGDRSRSPGRSSRLRDLRVGVAPNVCCGRPSYLQRSAVDALANAPGENVNTIVCGGRGRKKFVFCEPSCLSAVREDAPSLLRGEEQRKAEVVGSACMLFEEFVETELADRSHSSRIHGSARARFSSCALPSEVDGSAACCENAAGSSPWHEIVDPDAGCCGMAGSFGYSREHFEVSRQIGERRLFPAVRNSASGNDRCCVRLLVPASDPRLHTINGDAPGVSAAVPLWWRAR